MQHVAEFKLSIFNQKVLRPVLFRFMFVSQLNPGHSSASFYSKDADWSGHTPTTCFSLEFFKMDLKDVRL